MYSPEAFVRIGAVEIPSCSKASASLFPFGRISVQDSKSSAFVKLSTGKACPHPIYIRVDGFSACTGVFQCVIFTQRECAPACRGNAEAAASRA